MKFSASLTSSVKCKSSNSFIFYFRFFFFNFYFGLKLQSCWFVSVHVEQSNQILHVNVAAFLDLKQSRIHDDGWMFRWSMCLCVSVCYSAHLFLGHVYVYVFLCLSCGSLGRQTAGSLVVNLDRVESERQFKDHRPTGNNQHSDRCLCVCAWESECSVWTCTFLSWHVRWFAWVLCCLDSAQVDVLLFWNS